MFGGAYGGAAPSDRPKYGCLNLTGDYAGVKGARRYGPLFLMLGPEVRHRTTFANEDTGGAAGQQGLATVGEHARQSCSNVYLS